jgi:hypothetical protein
MDSRDDCRKTAFRYFFAAQESGDLEATIILLESAQQWVRLAASAEAADYGLLAQPNPVAAQRDPSSGGCLLRGAIYKGVADFWTRLSAQPPRH